MRSKPAGGIGSNQYQQKPGGPQRPRAGSTTAIIEALQPSDSSDLSETDRAEQVAFAFTGQTINRQIVSDDDCPSWLLDLAARDDSVGVRAAVAANPNTLPSTLERLARDIKAAVVTNALDNPNCPSSVPRLKRYVSIGDRNTIRATSDDFAVAAAVAVREDGYVKEWIPAGQDPGNPTSRSTLKDAKFVVLGGPATAEDLNGDTPALVEIPAGVYKVEDIDDGSVWVDRPDGAGGWVSPEHLGVECDACRGEGSFNIGSPGDPEIDDCGDCQGIGRLPEPSLTAVPEIAAGHPARWPVP